MLIRTRNQRILVPLMKSIWDVLTPREKIRLAGVFPQTFLGSKYYNIADNLAKCPSILETCWDLCESACRQVIRNVHRDMKSEQQIKHLLYIYQNSRIPCGHGFFIREVKRSSVVLCNKDNVCVRLYVRPMVRKTQIVRRIKGIGIIRLPAYSFEYVNYVWKAITRHISVHSAGLIMQYFIQSFEK